MSHLRPKIGVAAVISNAQGQVLVGKRRGSHGAGTWQFPGGHLEYQEQVNACAERETLEETALRVSGDGVLAVTNDIFEGDGKHYITLFVHCEMLDPQNHPQVMEPHKCEGWQWKTWEELRVLGQTPTSAAPNDKLFLPIVNLFKQTSNPQSLISQGRRL